MEHLVGQGSWEADLQAQTAEWLWADGDRDVSGPVPGSGRPWAVGLGLSRARQSWWTLAHQTH